MWKLVYLTDLFIWWWLIISIVTGDLRIRVPLTNQEVTQGETVKFVCDVVTSPGETDKVFIRWKFNEEVIKPSKSSRFNILGDGQTLKIQNAHKTEQGDYTCIASIRKMKDRSTARLIIKTTPSPPKNIELVTCMGHKADLVWEDGEDGGDVIKGYLVQYNTSVNPNYWNHNYEEISKSAPEPRTIDLSPWGTYSFRVLARNSIGYSEPSLPTKSECRIPPGHPDGNPEKVGTKTDKKYKLVITWEPMPRLEHNGPGFRYHVFWRPKGSTYWKNMTVWDENADELELDVNDIYGLYEVKVKAVNDIGESYQPAFIILGHSGEAEPLLSPKDFRLDPMQPIQPHKAHFIWESVDTSQDKIRGRFRGYKLRYWKSSEGRHKWEEVDVIVETSDDMYLRDVRAAISGLPAYTALRAQVSVMNDHYTGPPSATIDFSTPEGVPGPVRHLHEHRIGSTYVVLKWLPPEEPNGVLMGYDIGYQPIKSSQVGNVIFLEPKISNPSVLRAQIKGLKADHTYRFLVWARTQTGRGEPSFIDVETTNSRPGIPHPIVSAVDRTSFNITWRPEHFQRDVQYFLEYKREGEIDWEKTKPEFLKSWKVVNGLRSNTKYQVRLVAMNKFGETTYSKNFPVFTDATAYGDGAQKSYDASIGKYESFNNHNIAKRHHLSVICAITTVLTAFITVFQR
ncbi:neuroglian-like [Mytilus californianus]|uniref:neuroglian-like n=1 Tax=Mytilus californianus TaxID=6549 RepID=UPI0022457222|nr:neuroglian-like [Mytilus californianus]XP_052096649.1 neuroglian-like [Mytilus californianus]XP_052096706.1 neuroglian-like [Mytilus californianus]